MDQRMLPSRSSDASTYSTQEGEGFRMPRMLQAPLPQVPTGVLQSALAPTTVCVLAVVSDAGEVQRVDPLDDREECRAGLAPANAALLQAVRAQMMQWRFVPAAICTWPTGVTRSSTVPQCDGAASVRPVPISLPYAFTFEVREGKVMVRGGDR